MIERERVEMAQKTRGGDNKCYERKMSDHNKSDGTLRIYMYARTMMRFLERKDILTSSKTKDSPGNYTQTTKTTQICMYVCEYACMYACIMLMYVYVCIMLMYVNE